MGFSLENTKILVFIFPLVGEEGAKLLNGQGCFLLQRASHVSSPHQTIDGSKNTLSQSSYQLQLRALWQRELTAVQWHWFLGPEMKQHLIEMPRCISSPRDISHCWRAVGYWWAGSKSGLGETWALPTHIKEPVLKSLQSLEAHQVTKNNWAPGHDPLLPSQWGTPTWPGTDREGYCCTGYGCVLDSPAPSLAPVILALQLL